MSVCTCHRVCVCVCAGKAHAYFIKGPVQGGGISVGLPVRAPQQNVEKNLSDNSGHTSTCPSTQIKRIKTRLGVNSISPVEALCTAGIQEAQHLNRERGAGVGG